MHLCAYSDLPGGATGPRLSPQRFSLERTAQADEAARQVFEHARALVLRDLVTPEFLALLERIWSSDAFEIQEVDGVGARAIEARGRAGAALALALSRREFLDWLQAITGVGPLARVDGGLARHGPQDRGGLDWHDDGDDPTRRLAVTISLGRAPYAGGLFELRRKGAPGVLATHLHEAPGAALIFAVEPGLEHRLTPVTAGGPRTVFAGWAFESRA